MRVSGRRRGWQRAYSNRLVVTDLIVISASVFGGQLLWFGFQPKVVTGTIPVLDGSIGYSAFSVLLVALWMVSLRFFATRDVKVVGSGSDEYRRVVDATIRLFGLIAITMFLLQWQLGRGYFLTALPLGLFLTLSSRVAWRQWLRRQRRAGRYVHRALLIGERQKSEHVMESVARDPYAGIVAIGALTVLGSTDRDLAPGVPVLGSFSEIVQAVSSTGADTVIMTGSDELGPLEMRRLGWALEDKNVALIVAPALTDVAGPRIHARPVAGLPLIHVEYPTFEGRKRASKRLFDIVASLLLILVSSPVMIAVAIAVKATSPGAIFYKQERIGLRGTPFGMLKFRSMVNGADDQLKSLLDEQGTSEQPLFKINNDPRITPVGKFIRRYSLDELPQFFNVLLGSMALVGPRPQVAGEVALYDDAAHRRLFMKPGISGLWQVSGRSELSWEDAIRLDLYYVENWSMTADLVILWKTVRAVVLPGTEAH
ncbi:sugar transferase [Mycetocola zhadangensis]|uniref:sugar transferase n=1 Tax=Mycetocola zhadangensis TaxID=1164595 RepID=UPI003A4DEFED